MAATNLTSPPSANLSIKRPRFQTPAKLRDQITGYLFIFPAVLLIFLFGLFPIGYALYMSLHRYSGIRRGSFIGTDNYIRIFGDWTGLLFFVAGFLLLFAAYWVWDRAFKADRDRTFILRTVLTLAGISLGLAVIAYGWNVMTVGGDSRFLRGLIITFYFAFGTVPMQIGVGLILAYVLFQKIRGKELYRMIFFLPYVTPAVASAVVFRTVFSPRETSLANQFITSLGIDPQRWIQEPQPFVNAFFGLNLEGFLAGPSMALVSIILLNIWTYAGYNAVIFMAGLGNIPGDLYEAARVDGASEWHLFRHITLPLLSPVTFYLSILGFIGTFKAFNSIYVMRTPQALGTTDTASIVVFDTFFQLNQYGYATAQAIMLLCIILALTQAQRTIFEGKVFYG